MADPVVSPPEVAFPSPLEHSRRQRGPAGVSEAIAQQRDLPALFHDLAERLHSVVDFDFLTLVLHDPVRNVMRLHVLETRIPSEKPTGTEAPVENNPSGWVWQTQESFVVSDVEKETRFPEFLKRFREHNVRALAIIPLTTAQRRLGAMGFGRLVPQCITDTELQFMQRVASQVAVAVDNALNFESSQAYQKQLSLERDRLQALLEVNNVLVTSRELPEVFRGIVSTLKRVIHHDYTSLALLDPVTACSNSRTDFPGHQGLFKRKSPLRGSFSRRHCHYHGPAAVARGGAQSVHQTSFAYSTKACSRLLRPAHHGTAARSISPAAASRFSSGCGTSPASGAQIAIAVENALAFKEIDALKNKLAVEKLYLEEEIRSEFNFEEIVGESAVLKRALAQVELAAPAGTTVLLLGETGTGKELFARAIHNLSPRRDRTFVKINCAAIPSGLLESELFGHEKGAFTGAIAQKVGRFELADRGTLFLDEVGDSRWLQPKLPFCRNRNSNASEARARLALTCASSLPPTPIFRNWSPSAPFAATSITASTCFPFKSPRCASGRTIFLSSSAISCKDSAAASIKRSSTFPLTPWTRFRIIPGPATSVNSRISSNAPSSFLPVRNCVFRFPS
jgi:formate hydrogenlyase transcriptional activator